MSSTESVLEVGPVSVEVPATAGVEMSEGGWFAAWSSKHLLTVSAGRYSVSITDEWMLLVRKYER